MSTVKHIAYLKNRIQHIEDELSKPVSFMIALNGKEEVEALRLRLITQLSELEVLAVLGQED